MSESALKRCERKYKSSMLGANFDVFITMILNKLRTKYPLVASNGENYSEVEYNLTVISSTLVKEIEKVENQLPILTYKVTRHKNKSRSEPLYICLLGKQDDKDQFNYYVSAWGIYKFENKFTLVRVFYSNLDYSKLYKPQLNQVEEKIKEIIEKLGEK